MITLNCPANRSSFVQHLRNRFGRPNRLLYVRNRSHTTSARDQSGAHIGLYFAGLLKYALQGAHPGCLWTITCVLIRKRMEPNRLRAIFGLDWFNEPFRISQMPTVIPGTSSAISYTNRSYQYSGWQFSRWFSEFSEGTKITRSLACINIDTLSDICILTTVFDLLVPAENLFSVRLSNTKRSTRFHAHPSFGIPDHLTFHIKSACNKAQRLRFQGTYFWANPLGVS